MAKSSSITKNIETKCYFIGISQSSLPMTCTDVSILLKIGPFVDSLHPKIKAGDTDLTPANIFRAQFTAPLRSFLNASPESIVIIVPAVRDLVSNHAVFPQAELEPELIGTESVRLVDESFCSPSMLNFDDSEYIFFPTQHAFQ